MTDQGRYPAAPAEEAEPNQSEDNASEQGGTAVPDGEQKGFKGLFKGKDEDKTPPGPK